MPSSHLGSTHDRTTSSVACHHRLWTSSHSRTASGVAYHHCPLTENAVERRWAWRAIIALGQHTRSNDVRRGITSPPFDSTHGRTTSGKGMPSSPLGSTHGRTTSGVACHYIPWTANTVKRRQAWHAIIAFGQHKWRNDIGHGIPSSPFDSMHGRTTSGVACHHRPWAAQTVERR